MLFLQNGTQAEIGGLRSCHVPFPIYTTHVFGRNFVIFKNYLRLYFMEKKWHTCLIQTMKSLETLNVHIDRLWPCGICIYVTVLMLVNVCVLLIISRKRNVVLYNVIYLLVLIIVVLELQKHQRIIISVLVIMMRSILLMLFFFSFSVPP